MLLLGRPQTCMHASLCRFVLGCVGVWVLWGRGVLVGVLCVEGGVLCVEREGGLCVEGRVVYMDTPQTPLDSQHTLSIIQHPTIVSHCEKKKERKNQPMQTHQLTPTHSTHISPWSTLGQYSTPASFMGEL